MDDRIYFIYEYDEFGDKNRVFESNKKVLEKKKVSVNATKNTPSKENCISSRYLPQCVTGT